MDMIENSINNKYQQIVTYTGEHFTKYIEIYDFNRNIDITQ